MSDRQKHQQEVLSFLEKHRLFHDSIFSLPQGSGMETYLVQGNGQNYFVKIGAPVERYLAMAEMGLTPQVLAFGHLEDGLSTMVQPYVIGRKPSRIDYRDRLEKVGTILYKMHNDQRIQETLPPASSNYYKDIGTRALGRLHQKWELHKPLVPLVAGFVDNSLDSLAQQINLFSGEGLVASHGDICNANWLFAANEDIYVVDFESMSMDDPALDIGALLWWYYPPELRQRFLDIAGYQYDDEFKFRIQIRMAMHCLDITLPREGSFDRFNPESFHESLRDFKAVLDGKENPEGYDR